jgi:hypothetical protein
MELSQERMESPISRTDFDDAVAKVWNACTDFVCR